MLECSCHLSLFHSKLGLGQRRKIVNICLVYMLSKFQVQIVKGFWDTAQILNSIWARTWLQAGHCDSSSWSINSLFWALIINFNLWRIESSFSRPKNQLKTCSGLRDMPVLPIMCHKAQKLQLRTILVFNIKVTTIA